METWAVVRSSGKPHAGFCTPESLEQLGRHVLGMAPEENWDPEAERRLRDLVMRASAKGLHVADCYVLGAFRIEEYGFLGRRPLGRNLDDGRRHPGLTVPAEPVQLPATGYGPEDDVARAWRAPMWRCASMRKGSCR